MFGSQVLEAKAEIKIKASELAAEDGVCGSVFGNLRLTFHEVRDVKLEQRDLLGQSETVASQKKQNF